MLLINRYLEVFLNGYGGYAGYLWNAIISPGWNNYFYWLILVSAFFFSLELLKPWREGQAKFRKDFWLDFFYMFFNFFLFSLIIYNAASDVVVELFNDGIKYSTGFDLQASNPMNNWPYWAILLTGFLVRDFVQWWVHRLLHRSSKLWEFHKVHHSVEQMGFAAHLRYHWMENVVYRTIEYIPLALLGIGLFDFFVIHIFTLSVGHFNHSNITVSSRIKGAAIGLLIGIVFISRSFDVHLLDGISLSSKLIVLLLFIAGGATLLGPLTPYLFNSPEMHIWHHSYELPEDKPYGINFGITLALWDYLFKTARIPHDGRDIKLGFPGLETFPDSFVTQNLYGFKSTKRGAK